MNFFKNIFGSGKAISVADIRPPVEVPAPPQGENEEYAKQTAMKKVNIKALEGTKMVPGKIYSVSEDNAKFLVKAGRAVMASENEKVGKVYKYPETKKSDLTD